MSNKNDEKLTEQQKKNRRKGEQVSEVKFDYCKKCGTPAMRPSEAWTVRWHGDRCSQLGCAGTLGTYEEWEQARREAFGIPALEDRITALEKRVAELERKARK